MDDLNLFHVLGERIRKLGHGVELSAQREIASKTLICYLDRLETLVYGFAYKNGSNLRVVTWGQNGRRANKTVPHGIFVIAFRKELSKRASQDEFVEADFEIGWFNDDAKRNVEEELRALIQKQDSVNEIVAGIAGLTVQQLDRVIETIQKREG